MISYNDMSESWEDDNDKEFRVEMTPEGNFGNDIMEKRIE